MNDIKKGDKLLGLYKVESDAIQGGSGLVYKVRHTKWNKEMAMKLPRAEEKFLETFRRECAIWADLGIHPNIAVCYYTRKIGDRLAVFSEWADEGSLGDMIKSDKLYENATDKKIVRIALESMRGLEYAHSRGLIHKDVKPLNILMVGGVARLNDFGLSELHRKGEEITQNFGEQTRSYASPEQLGMGNVTSKTDVYSWALTVLTMYTGEISRDKWGTYGIDAGEKAEALLKEAKVTVPDKMRELLLKCLEYAPKDRPDDAEILAALEEIYKEVCGEEPPAAYSEEVLECAAKTPGALNNRALIYVDIGEIDKAKECWAQAPNQLESVYNLALLEGTPLPELLQKLKDMKQTHSAIYKSVEAAAGSKEAVREYSVGEVADAKLDGDGKLLLKIITGIHYDNHKDADDQTVETSDDANTDSDYDEGLDDDVSDGDFIIDLDCDDVDCNVDLEDDDFEDAADVPDDDDFDDDDPYGIAGSYADPNDYVIDWHYEYEVLSLDLESGETSPADADTEFPLVHDENIIATKTTDGRHLRFFFANQLTEKYQLMGPRLEEQLEDGKWRVLQKFPANEILFPVVFLPDSCFVYYASVSKKLKLCRLPKETLNYLFSDTTRLSDELDGIKAMLEMLVDAEEHVKNRNFKSAASLIGKLEETHEFNYEWERFYRLKRTVGAAVGKSNFRVVSKKLLTQTSKPKVDFSNEYEYFVIYDDDVVYVYSCDAERLAAFNWYDNTIKDALHSVVKPGYPIKVKGFNNIKLSGKLCRMDVDAVEVEPNSTNEIYCPSYAVLTYDVEKGEFVDNSQYCEDMPCCDDLDEELVKKARAAIFADIGEPSAYGFNNDYSMFLELTGNNKSLYLNHLDFDIDDSAKGSVFRELGGGPLHLLDIKRAKPSTAVFPHFDEDESSDDNDNAGIKHLTKTAQRLNRLRDELMGEVIGQNHAVESFIDGMFKVLTHFDNGMRKKPRAIFTFAGPPGVGKTMLAEHAAAALGRPFKAFDMSEYSNHESGVGLIGSEAHWKGAHKGILTSYVLENPECILLFDEIEKAHQNIMHLFYQVLDEGVLTDKYISTDSSDERDGKVSFKDTIIIFTSNAGRAIYEDDSFISGAGVSTQEIIHALKTEKNPQTGEPFFPAALVSRISTGYPIMFSNHTPFTLLKIIKNQFRKICEVIRKRYGIEIAADENLFISMLLHEGGNGDARMITAKAEAFIYEELQKIASADSYALLNTKNINIEVELDNVSDEVNKLFNNTEKLRLLVCADEEFVKNKALDNDKYEVSAANGVEEALAFAKNNIDIAIIEITPTDGEPEISNVSPLEETADYNTQLDDKTSYVNPAAKRWGNAVRLFKALRDEYPEVPIYILTNSKNNISKELVMRFVRDGAQGSLKYGEGLENVIIKQLDDLSRAVHMQASAHTVAVGHRRLDFETVFTNPKDGTMYIKLRNLAPVKAPVSDDEDHPALKNAVKPDERFKDVIGAGEAKKALQKYKEFFENPRKYCENGEKPPRGVLLYGPPGTGKTMLAKAMAGECDVTFMTVAATELISKHVGGAAANVRRLFATARKYAPAIIFIDEVDAIAKKRADTASTNDETINTLLTEMDGFKTSLKRPVFVIAATNLKESLDDAFLRRFNTAICVDLPNQEERVDYVKQFLSGLGTELPEKDLAEFARRARGLSPAKIKNVLENAWNARSSEGLTLNHLLEALEYVRFGKLNEVADDEALKHTARHEAGHALINRLCGYTPSYLTIESRGNFGGYMEHSEEELKKHHLTRKDMLNRIRCALGGRAAEMVYYENGEGITAGACSDLKNATDIALSLITELGMDEEFGLAVIPVQPQEVSEDIRKRVNDILRGELQNAIDEIVKHREKFDELVEALMEKRRLTADAIEKILE